MLGEERPPEALSGYTGFLMNWVATRSRLLFANRLQEKWGYAIHEMPDPINEELCILDPWCFVPSWDGDGSPFERFSVLLERFGTDIAKELSPDFRMYQQRYGTDIVRNRIDVDRWVNIAHDHIGELAAEGRHNVAIPNIRALNEQDLCDLIVRVTRPGYDASAGDHEIEASIKLIESEFTLENDGTIEDLWAKVDRAWAEMGCVVS